MMTRSPFIAYFEEFSQATVVVTLMMGSSRFAVERKRTPGKRAGATADQRTPKKAKPQPATPRRGMTPNKRHAVYVAETPLSKKQRDEPSTPSAKRKKSDGKTLVTESPDLASAKASSAVVPATPRSAKARDTLRRKTFYAEGAESSCVNRSQASILAAKSKSLCWEDSSERPKPSASTLFPHLLEKKTATSPAKSSRQLEGVARLTSPTKGSPKGTQRSGGDALPRLGRRLAFSSIYLPASSTKMYQQPSATKGILKRDRRLSGGARVKASLFASPVKRRPKEDSSHLESQNVHHSTIAASVYIDQQASRPAKESSEESESDDEEIIFSPVKNTDSDEEVVFSPTKRDQRGVVRPPLSRSTEMVLSSTVEEDNDTSPWPRRPGRLHIDDMPTPTLGGCNSQTDTVTPTRPVRTRAPTSRLGIDDVRLADLSPRVGLVSASTSASSLESGDSYFEGEMMSVTKPRSGGGTQPERPIRARSLTRRLGIDDVSLAEVLSPSINQQRAATPSPARAKKANNSQGRKKKKKVKVVFASDRDCHHLRDVAGAKDWSVANVVTSPLSIISRTGCKPGPKESMPRWPEGTLEPQRLSRSAALEMGISPNR